MFLAAPTDTTVHGSVSPGFERVRDVFVENFAKRHERGGACCAYYKGRKVVDLWGGVRNTVTGDPWEADTMVLVYSATKGLAAIFFHRCCLISLVSAIAFLLGFERDNERDAGGFPPLWQSRPKRPRSLSSSGVPASRGCARAA